MKEEDLLQRIYKLTEENKLLKESNGYKRNRPRRMPDNSYLECLKMVYCQINHASELRNYETEHELEKEKEIVKSLKKKLNGMINQKMKNGETLSERENDMFENLNNIDRKIKPSFIVTTIGKMIDSNEKIEDTNDIKMNRKTLLGKIKKICREPMREIQQIEGLHELVNQYYNGLKFLYSYFDVDQMFFFMQFPFESVIEYQWIPVMFENYNKMDFPVNQEEKHEAIAIEINKRIDMLYSHLNGDTEIDLNMIALTNEEKRGVAIALDGIYAIGILYYLKYLSTRGYLSKAYEIQFVQSVDMLTKRGIDEFEFISSFTPNLTIGIPEVNIGLEIDLETPPPPSIITNYNTLFQNSFKMDTQENSLAHSLTTFEQDVPKTIECKSPGIHAFSMLLNDCETESLLIQKF